MMPAAEAVPAGCEAMAGACRRKCSGNSIQLIKTIIFSVYLQKKINNDPIFNAFFPSF